MKDDGVNRDTTIEVGDLVRVVKIDQSHDQYISDLDEYLGEDCIVDHIHETENIAALAKGGGQKDVWWFPFEWLEIMQPKAALKSVYAEKDSIRHKHLLAYELCEKMHEGYIEYDYLQQELQRIFDDRSGEED